MTPSIVVTAAVVERDGRFLVTRRLKDTHLEGYWEFPGGKCDPGEALDACLRRELHEELAVDAVIGAEILSTSHAYPERTVELHFFSVRLRGEPVPQLGQEMKWITRSELCRLPLPPADAELVELLLKNNDRSLSRYFLLLFGLCLLPWVIGAIVDIQLLPGFKLFQAGLAMPMIAALLLTYRERGWAGIAALLRRTCDVGKIKPRIWFLPILFVYPSLGFINYWIVRQAGTDIPSPSFSMIGFLGYGAVFFMTFAEELGLSGYAIDPMQERYSALTTGLLLGIAWAGYHIPGFLISGYYSAEWIAWHAIYTVATRVLFVWIYNNSGKSLFSMALCHWTFGLFWSLWPQDNLQQAVPFYKPQITAVAAVLYVLVVVYLWGPRTLARFRFAPMKQRAAL